ncbi:MAG: DNA primase [bacterium]
MSSPVDQIKEKLGVVELIGSYIKLDKAGNNWKGKCPFHHEKTPSFFVSPDKDYYYCFGCGAKGDIFSFVQNFEGLDFRGSLKVLADRAGVQLTQERSGVRDEKERLYDVMEEATIFFVGKLRVSPEPNEYLKKRGLTENMIRDWRIGFAPDQWRELSDFLRQRGYSDEEMEKAGLLKRTDTAAYDRFRGRIIFPLFDTAGRVVAFSGRILKNDDDIAKYLNSPETPLFIKSEILYGYDRAKIHIRKFDYSILVEGQMDLLMSHQAGFVNTVASSGTALTSEHLKLLKRLSNRVIMAFDSDNAGFKAAARAWKLALVAGLEVKIAQLPEKFDPADLILKGLPGSSFETGKEDWKNVLKEAKHIIDFFLSKLVIADKDGRLVANEVREQILPYVALLDSQTQQSHYISKISATTGLREDALWEDLRRLPKEKLLEEEIANKTKKPGSEDLRQDTIEKRLAGIIIWLAGKTDLDIFKDLENIRNKFISIISNDRWKIYAEASDTDKKDMIFQAEVSYGDHKSLLKEINILLTELEEEYYKKDLEKRMVLLTRAEKSGQADEAMVILQEINGLTKKINELKNYKKNLK